MIRSLAAFALAILVAVSGASPADAKPLERDPEIIRVIQAQMAAFKVDDGERAFSYATPDIQRMFGTAERFMRMVRQGYQAVYRPRSVTFLGLEAGPDAETVSQRVLVTGPDGNPQMAIYVMEQQADGAWLIDGCFLVDVPDETA